MQFIKFYLATIVPLMALDAVWLGLIVKDFNVRNIGFVINTFKPAPAIFFYLIYAAGLVYFVMRPTEGEPILKIFLTGALFGLCTYATYDLTNQATIEGWPIAVTLTDMTWGAFASGTAVTIAAFLTRA
ncbi:MAG: DUF2177 family protein [Candidatus Pacebacteria bacterium]|nr:DUF2177 family protein [Candidatus Paceibacterota bacterium]